ncbi:hypothetical protein AB0C33_40675 [Nonomuraea sp. NPDC048881]|uniref:hypothetical protein n=1 Tax=unclassified Nonomuraea TaxID=2593643 RepID=UPI003400BF63
MAGAQHIDGMQVNGFSIGDGGCGWAGAWVGCCDGSGVGSGGGSVFRAGVGWGAEPSSMGLLAASRVLAGRVVGAKRKRDYDGGPAPIWTGTL